jgi:hypothetical protein
MSAPHTPGGQCVECEGFCLIPVPKVVAYLWPSGRIDAGLPVGQSEHDRAIAAQCTPLVVGTSTVLAAAALLSELQIAHQIIRSALHLMTTEQKEQWAKANDRDGLIESGTTRYHERAAVIATATGSAA